MGEPTSELRVDPLFLGMTRPPMALGVTFSSFVLDVVATTIAFLATSDLRAFLLFFPVHGLAYVLCLRDPRIFDLLLVRAAKTPPIRNGAVFGAKSYAP
jgi:type IV secretion system protein VirB3